MANANWTGPIQIPQSGHVRWLDEPQIPEPMQVTPPAPPEPALTFTHTHRDEFTETQTSVSMTREIAFEGLKIAGAVLAALGVAFGTAYGLSAGSKRTQPDQPKPRLGRRRRR